MHVSGFLAVIGWIKFKRLDYWLGLVERRARADEKISGWTGVLCWINDNGDLHFFY
jgi:hypothetical protein